MGTQRNHPQSIGKEESSGRVLNEVEASQISDIDFKTMVIRNLNDNYPPQKKPYREATRNLLYCGIVHSH